MFVYVCIMCECVCECLFYKLRNTMTDERGRKMFIVKKKEFFSCFIAYTKRQYISYLTSHITVIDLRLRALQKKKIANIRINSSITFLKGICLCMHTSKACFDTLNSAALFVRSSDNCCVSANVPPSVTWTIDHIVSAKWKWNNICFSKGFLSSDNNN